MREIENLLENIQSTHFREMPNREFMALLEKCYNLGLQDAAELSITKFYAGESGYLNKESVENLKINLEISKT
jgi:hypothetical protein